MAKAAARKGPKARKAAAPVALDKPSAPPSVSVAGFDLAELRELIELVQGTGIGELELGSSGRSVRISAAPSAGGNRVAATHPLSAPAAAAIPAAEARPMTAPPVNQTPVTSPMVGTFYRSPAPDADPFVEVGDIIEVGQTVCIIEAMKLMNEIESEVKGRVVQILVDNAQAVEFGQKLFLVEPV